MQHLSAGGEMTSNQSPAAPPVATSHLIQRAFASAASSPYVFDRVFTVIPRGFCGLSVKIREHFSLGNTYEPLTFNVLLILLLVSSGEW